MTNWAQVERRRLAHLLEQVGPDAPTLCGNWRTRDLAAHLILRERRPDAAVGIVVKRGPFGRHTESVQRELADPARDWATTVETIRQGPPRWSPMRLRPLDQVANTVEFFVHHEDVRRGDPQADPAGARPRHLEPDLSRALTTALRRVGGLLRRTPHALELRLPNGQVILRRPAHGDAKHDGTPKHDGTSAPETADGTDRPVRTVLDGTVVVTGEPGELLLFAYGRQAVAVVDLAGAPALLDAVGRATFGI